MSLKQRWQAFAEAPVGKRFQARYHSSHQTPTHWINKLLSLVIGGVVVLAGLLMLIAPGPGLLVFVLGAVLLAQESLLLARLLDFCDRRGRSLAARLLSAWRNAGWGLRGLVILAACASVAGLVLLGWFIWREL